jgi:ABC-type lipoprotein export system ATPase subunit
MEPIIRLEHVNFWYDRGKPVEYYALRDVSFEIKKGDYVAFFGASGSGKSTLLYLIAGIEKGQEGKIVVNGRDMSSLSQQELAIYRQVGVGMIFQQFNLIASLSVIQNVMFSMMFLGVAQDKAKEEAEGLLKRVNLLEYADRLPTELSGGQQQRVSIARALANNPPIIVADEPLGNLDSTNAQAILELLKELNEKDNRTVIMVTHEAWSLRDVQRIFYIKDGAVTGDETEKAKVPGASPQETLSRRLYGQLNPELSEHQLAAHALAELLLRGYPAEEVSRAEVFLAQWLDGKLGKDEFRAILGKPWKDGGVGLWPSRADRVVSWVDGIATEKQTLQEVYRELERNPEAPLYDDIEKLKTWLLEEYRGTLSASQDAQLMEIISERIRGVIATDAFVKTLNLPRSKSGLNFSIHTAHRIGEKFDLILGGGKPAAGAAGAA